MKKRLLSISLMALAIIIPTKLWAQEPYAVLSDDNTVLTFYYDDQRDARGGSMDLMQDYASTQWMDVRDTVGGLHPIRHCHAQQHPLPRRLQSGWQGDVYGNQRGDRRDTRLLLYGRGGELAAGGAPRLPDKGTVRTYLCHQRRSGTWQLC